jgi:hypothetical protein
MFFLEFSGEFLFGVNYWKESRCILNNAISLFIVEKELTPSARHTPINPSILEDEAGEL